MTQGWLLFHYPMTGTYKVTWCGRIIIIIIIIIVIMIIIIILHPSCIWISFLLTKAIIMAHGLPSRRWAFRLLWEHVTGRNLGIFGRMQEHLISFHGIMQIVDWKRLYLHWNVTFYRRSAVLVLRPVEAGITQPCRLGWLSRCGIRAGRKVKEDVGCVVTRDYDNREITDGKCHQRMPSFLDPLKPT